MKYVVLGAAGQLGRDLVPRLPGDVVGLARDRADLTRPDELRATLTVLRPDAVINCIGIIKQLAAAKDPFLSIAVNSLLPHRLHRLCRATGARLIHFSTDCVFSGRAGNYSEDDPSDALIERVDGAGSVPVVGRGDDDGIDLLHLQ